MGKRALLTGATGFVGANLARRLLRDGHELHLLARPGYRGWRLDEIRADVRLHTVDLGDAAALAGLVEHIRPEWVFHLAAYGAYASQADPGRMIQTNLAATANLVEACLKTGFEAFIHTGSSSEYGFKDHPPAEDEWIDPNSMYAVTKAAATHFCRCTARSREAPMRTLRLYSVYGPYEEPTRLIPTLIVRGLAGQLPPLVNPATARDYVYTEDVNEAYVLAASAPGQAPGAVYNVGTGIQTSLRQVVAAARAALNITAEPEWGSMAGRQWDTSVWVADNRAIRQALGWTPRYTFAQGFRLTADWLRDSPALLALYQSQRTPPA